MKKKFNNLGYKIACLLIGLFVLATVLMAWIGGLSTIPKKSLTASADTQTDSIAYVYLSPFYGSFAGSGYIVTQDTPVFVFNFNSQTYSFAYYSTTENKLINGSYSSNLNAYYITPVFTNFVSYTNTISTSIYLNSQTWTDNSTVTAINSVEYSFVPKNTSESYLYIRLNVSLSNSNTGAYIFRVEPMMPWQIPASFSTTPIFFNKQILNISPDNLNSYNNQVSFDQGYEKGKAEGKEEGRRLGETVGYNRALSELSEGTTFSELLNAIFFAPTTFLYNLLNFEILGVNIYGIFTAILTIGVMSFIVRLFL